MTSVRTSTFLCAAALLSFIAFSAAAHAAAAPEPGGLSQIGPVMEKRLQSFNRELDRPMPTVTVRNLPNGALASLALGHDPKEAERFLRELFRVQDMDPQSATYGSVPWQENHPEIHDLNSDEFSTQALGPILIQYGDRLSPTLRADLAAHIRAFYAALKRRNFRNPSYTNIFVMRAVETLLMGEAIGDADMADQGCRWLDDWIAYTAKAGIREFDSPTYTAVDLNSLYLGWRYAKRPGAREKFQSVLNLFWTDIAANYFPARGNLAGPHSRDYDFLGGWGGGLGYYYGSAGLRDDGTSNMIDFERVYPYLNAQPGNYRPSARILALTALPERTVRSRWDEPPAAHDRYAYLTPDFALGGATGDYGAQDKLISVELPGSKTPVISINPDFDDSPYGTVKTSDGSGHQKATHLPLGPTCVQDRNVLFAMLDIDLRGPAGQQKQKYDAPRVATSILLPAKADRILLDGQPVTASGPVWEQTAHVGSVVGVRVGEGGVAIRLLAAGNGGKDGDGATVVLKSDAEGAKHDVIRLVAYTPHTGAAGERLPVAVLMIAARCPDDAALQTLVARAAAATYMQQRDGNLWTASVTDEGHTYNAVRDMAKRTAVRRRIDGKDLPDFPVLEVNGRVIP